MPEEESLMMSAWPVYKEEDRFEAEEDIMGHLKEIVRGVRNVRAEMNVPNNRKAKVYVVCQDEALSAGMGLEKEASKALMNAADIMIQSTKDGISEDAVSVVVPDATVYLPLEELIDFEQERERLNKEKERLTKEIARSNGMLSNEKFLSKAPEAKVNEEKEKLETYTQMMRQVEERLLNLQK